MSISLPPGLIDALKRSDHTVVLTGSGISAESGVPTFRDAQTGLWSKYGPHELATQEAFDRNPGLVWRWYQWRRQLVAEARPNAGHLALVTMQSLLKRVTLITQNVDGLHQHAGSASVIEFHGNIHRNVCSLERTASDPVEGDYREPPRCPRCGGNLRPDVVWFGEPIPASALQAAQDAATDCDLLLSVGTSSEVYPAAGLADVALGNGATIVEINPNETPLTRRTTYVLAASAGVVLPALTHALQR